MTRPNLLPAGSEPLRHGYRLADVHRIALMAAASRYTQKRLPHHDRVDIAWHAIITELYERTDPPTVTHLAYVGAAAISQATDVEAHHAGRQRHTWAPAPRFIRYWHTDNHDSHEDALVERLALPQVLALLSPEQREALAALAAAGSREAAAALLGLTPSGMDSRLLRARAVIYAAWWEGETPPRRRRDYRVHRYQRSDAA